MSKDVLITPATGLVEFKGASGNTDATIQLDDSGNLNLTSPNGDISIGDTTSDLYIGDGVNNVDIIFEQSGSIRALTGKTLTLGQSDATVRVNAPLQITNTTLVANLNADLLDGIDSTSFLSFSNTAHNTANAAFYHANSAFDTANTNTTSITNLQGVNLTQNTSITAAFGHANAAFESANSAGSSVAVGDSPPDSPTANSLWWQSNTGTLKIYYNDGDSTQWVEAIAIPTTLVDQFARDTANNASGSSIALAIALG